MIAIQTDNGKRYYYSSITACLQHRANPIKITNRRWSQIIKDKGYPFEHSGCYVEKVAVLSIKDVTEG